MKPVVVAVVIMLSLAATGWGQAVSDFESGSQGWKIYDSGCSGNWAPHYGTHNVVHIASGGDPGAFIRAEDPSSNCFFLAAPPAFLGDQSPCIGGRLSFSMRSSYADYASADVVVLVGAGQLLVTELPYLPGTDWTWYVIDLVHSDFRYSHLGGAVVTAADFAAVMSGLTALRLPAEYGSTVSETVDLDTVALLSRFADVNGDCTADTLDLLHMAIQWLGPPGAPSADLYADGTIDLMDLALLAGEYLQIDPGCSVP